jgi:hypothetical protein
MSKENRMPSVVEVDGTQYLIVGDTAYVISQNGAQPARLRITEDSIEHVPAAPAVETTKPNPAQRWVPMRVWRESARARSMVAKTPEAQQALMQQAYEQPGRWFLWYRKVKGVTTVTPPTSITAQGFKFRSKNVAAPDDEPAISGWICWPKEGEQ